MTNSLAALRNPNITIHNKPDLKLLRFSSNQTTDAGKITLALNKEFDRAEKQLGIETNEKPAQISYQTLTPVAAETILTQRIRNFTNITEKLIYNDTLTGLLNKRAYQKDRIDLFIDSCQKQQPISLISFDLDKFKSYNDTFGHPEGDVALAEFGRIVKETLGENGKAYRVGGEELIALLPNRTLQETQEIAEDIRNNIETQTLKLLETNKLKRALTVSIGYSSFNPTNEVKDAKELYKKEPSTKFRSLFENTFIKMEEIADNSLYEAKNTGRNKIVGAEIF
ncbi:MAG TPA: GGDEF domain-containing protein [Candidatus Gastranaerophilales bacterium]|nr:GGDEF domain-containing protein [Candidatus Gastranaerophilales bacterium]